MAKKNNIDWDAIENAYVTGTESQRTLAARFGVAHQNVSKKSKELGWVEKRKKFRAEACANAWQNALRAREEEIIEGLRATDIVNRRAIELLEDANFLDYIITISKAPGKELESLSKVIINTEEARRMLRGILKPADDEKLRLEREKWQHEIKREEEEETGKGIVQVTFDPELEEFSE